MIVAGLMSDRELKEKQQRESNPDWDKLHLFVFSFLNEAGQVAAIGHTEVILANFLEMFMSRKLQKRCKPFFSILRILQKKTVFIHW